MSRKTVLLINPRICSTRSMRLPLSLLALGAVLEDKYEYRIVDGNVDPDPVGSAREVLAAKDCALAGITVMPGPQVGPAIEISKALRASHPDLPIAWGGYFPSMYPDAAINADYVDFVVRGQGEITLLDLLEKIQERGGYRETSGLTWKEDGTVRHNPERRFQPPDEFPAPVYDRVGNVRQYLRPSFMGRRTGVHQAAIGCRYKCSFCGVVSMFNGLTRLSAPARTRLAMETLRDRYGADSMQFYDNNFFDREETSVLLLEAMAPMGMPWWCYARADTLANFSAKTWDLIRRSRLRMAYIGAEASSDAVLKSMKKGTRVEQTLEVAARCRENGVIPEFSFVLGGPNDPEGEIEKTLTFIKRVKQIHPECEVILYFYSPTPQRDPDRVSQDQEGANLPSLDTYGPAGPPLPTTPEEWTEPRWINYVCHQDAPWLSPRMRRRVKDFAQVLACRFPTLQDVRTPRWGKQTLRALSSWRYATGRYDSPWELQLARRVIPLRAPEKESL